MGLNMCNNQKINIDWKLRFICQQQGKDKLRSTPHRIKTLLSNLIRSWRLGALDIICSSVISALHDEAELKNHLTEKEAKSNKVCANRYDSHKLQRPIDNQKNIPEADNSVEASPSLSR